VSGLDGATHTQKDGLESSGSALMKGVAEIFLLFLCGKKMHNVAANRKTLGSVRTIHL